MGKERQQANKKMKEKKNYGLGSKARQKPYIVAHILAGHVPLQRAREGAVNTRQTTTSLWRLVGERGAKTIPTSHWHNTTNWKKHSETRNTSRTCLKTEGIRHVLPITVDMILDQSCSLLFVSQVRTVSWVLAFSPHLPQYRLKINHCHYRQLTLHT